MADDVLPDDLDFGQTIQVSRFAPGQKIFRRYTLQKVLGRGGMGVVWLARDEQLEQKVALKFLPEVLFLDRSMMDNLKRETRRSLELTHKNIVRIYDFVSDETSACISMEYIDGDTLSNLRVDRPNKVFETHELLEWTKELCEALDYAHHHARVVHCDLKPSNLMVNQRGDLKVADFGIARRLSDSVSMLTMGRHTSGTLVYMSPQQIDGDHGSPLDDIYSLGATFYELLTSRPPFYSGNIDRQIHERVPPRMSQRREEFEVEGEPIDEAWENLVAACLQKDPAYRPQSAAEIVQWLTAPAPAPEPAPKTTRFKFLGRQKTQLETGERQPPTAKTRPPTATTRPPTAEGRPPTAEIRSRTATIPPEPEVPRPQRVRKKKFRRAAVAMMAGISAAIQTTARGAALIVIVPSKAIVRGAEAVGLAVEKALQSLVAAIASVSKAIFDGSVHAMIAIGSGLRAAAVALVAGSKVIVPVILTAALIWLAVQQRESLLMAARRFSWKGSESPKRPPPPAVVKPPAVKVAPSAAPTESPIVPVPATAPPVLQPPPESTPPPAIEGSLSLEITPEGATVIVNGSEIKTGQTDRFTLNGKVHERKTLPNLRVGKHHVQIVMPGYNTEEMEAEVKGGQTTSLGVIALLPISPPQPSTTPYAVQATPTEPAREKEKPKVVSPKKTPGNKHPSPAPAKKPPPPVTRPPAAAPPPHAAATPKPKSQSTPRRTPPPPVGPPGG